MAFLANISDLYLKSLGTTAARKETFTFLLIKK